MKEMASWGVIWCFMIEILDCKSYSSKTVTYNLQITLQVTLQIALPMKSTNIGIYIFKSECNKCNI